MTGQYLPGIYLEAPYEAENGHSGRSAAAGYDWPRRKGKITQITFWRESRHGRIEVFLVPATYNVRGQKIKDEVWMAQDTMDWGDPKKVFPLTSELWSRLSGRVAPGSIDFLRCCDKCGKEMRRREERVKLAVAASEVKPPSFGHPLIREACALFGGMPENDNEGAPFPTERVYHLCHVCVPKTYGICNCGFAHRKGEDGRFNCWFAHYDAPEQENE